MANRWTINIQIERIDDGYVIGLRSSSPLAIDPSLIGDQGKEHEATAADAKSYLDGKLVPLATSLDNDPAT